MFKKQKPTQKWIHLKQKYIMLVYPNGERCRTLPGRTTVEAGACLVSPRWDHNALISRTFEILMLS